MVNSYKNDYKLIHTYVTVSRQGLKFQSSMANHFIKPAGYRNIFHREKLSVKNNVRSIIIF